MHRRTAGAPGNVRCCNKDTGLAKDSVVNMSQVATIDRTSLLMHVGTLPPALLGRVEEGLRLVLAL